jgi:hypothetical protein
MASPSTPWPVRIYPRWWRARYGDEMAALLEARPLRARALPDLLRGALDAHFGGDGRPSPHGAMVMLLAGGAWTVVGAATIASPTPPDWPGVMVETLPIGAVGAVAVLGAVLSVGRRGWASAGRMVETAIIVAVLAHVAWAGALFAAAVGGPYGAITAALQSAAAITTVGIGLLRTRAGDHPISLVTLAAGVAFLIPSPAAWLLAGGAWTGLGLIRLAEDRSFDDRGFAR